MAFFDFLKRKKKEEKTDRIKLGELGEWIQNKKKQTEENFLIIIKNRISQLINELENQIVILEKIDLKKTKVEERVKLIVKGNLAGFIIHLKKLIEDLRNLGKEKDITEKINPIFLNFEKKSMMSFHKVTFIVGEEMGKVKECIVNFSNDLKNILQKNKEQIVTSKTADLIEIWLKKLGELEKVKTTIGKNIENFKQKINILENEEQAINKNIKKIKQTQGYIGKEKKKEEFESKKEQLIKEICLLREMIDFKFMSRTFHSDKKKMKTVKEYKENFQEVFEEDKGAGIIGLLDEAKINKENIEEKIREIAKKKEEIDNTIIEKDETENLESEIRNIKTALENLDYEKSRELKKYRKFEENKNKIISSIKEELSKIKVEVG